MKSKYKLAILQTHPIQYFAPLFRRLAQEPDIDLTVLYCSHQGLHEYVDEGFGQQVKWDIPLLEGYHHKFLPNIRQQDEVTGFFSLVNPTVIQELIKGGYDALWIPGHNHATLLMAILVAKFLSIPVWVRCDSHLLLQKSPLKRALRRPVMSFFYRQLCRACLAIGTRNYEFYRSHGVGRHRLFWVPFTVDNDFFMTVTGQFRGQENVIKTELGLPLDKPLILFASKFIARKRPLDLLIAYHRLRNMGTDAALLLIGSGAEEAKLRDYVEEHQVPDVYFLGFRNQSELPQFFAIADVFVLPAEDEPWGLIINEVMCAGLPVIATEEIGATIDLVKPGHTGFVYKTGDTQALTAHLQALVTDTKLRASLGHNAQQLIAEWNFDRCVQGIKAALMAQRPKRKATYATTDQHTKTDQHTSHEVEQTSRLPVNQQVSQSRSVTINHQAVSAAGRELE